MRKKMKDLCSSFPKNARLQSPLDQVGTEMFKPLWDGSYIQSSATPEERYGIGIDRMLMQHHNDLLEDFQRLYGPNERYLINKILRSPHNLIYVIGGIGVGKTSFTHYLITSVLDKLRHEAVEKTDKCPCPIYIDFLSWGAGTFTGMDFDKVQVTFSEMLCTRIEHEIADRGYLEFEEEVGEVWEQLLKSDLPEYRKNAAVSHIRVRLRLEDAEGKHLEQNYTETIAKRKQIRREIAANSSLRRFYVGALLRYIKASVYDNHPGCFLLVVDNIDREPTAVQHAIKVVLKPFAWVSNIKTVVNARQTTYYQALDDNMSDTVDQVAYCGASPLEIVMERVNRFIAHPEKYSSFYTPEDLPTLVRGVTILRDNFLKRDWFSAFFRSLTGRSIRKALILAQRLVDNSVYDPYQVGKDGAASLRQSDVVRALMVGPNSTYSWSRASLIDNIFQVHEQSRESYFIKIRVLKALSLKEEPGLKVKTLLALLKGYGYEAELILDALNEMMPASKRLIWSDEVESFKSVTDLTEHGNAHLYITTIGKGYGQHLFKLLDYIQEVMVDTDVDSVEIGSNWDYGKMEGRLDLTAHFCAMILEHDEKEVKLFVSEHGKDVYRNYFGSDQLISKEILESVSHNMESILNFVSDHSQRGPSFSEFKRELSKFFLDRILRARRFEYEYLGSG